MSSELTLRIILFIIGLFILAGIVLHDYLTRRRGRPAAARSKRREPRLGKLELPVPDDVEEEAEPGAWGDFAELEDPPLLNDQAVRGAAPAPPAPQAAPKPPPPPPPLHVRKAGAMASAAAPLSVPSSASTARGLSAAGANGSTRGGATPDKIITLYVRARSGRRISGVELLDAAIKIGLQFGERKIFHRLDEGHTEPIFSMANLIKPGYFDPGSWNVFETPGVALFMTLPGAQSALDTWDVMHAAGQRLADLLNAELLDDGRCRMTRQRIGQMREEMREYDRRREIKRDLDHDH